MPWVLHPADTTNQILAGLAKVENKTKNITAGCNELLNTRICKLEIRIDYLWVGKESFVAMPQIKVYQGET